MGMKISGFDKVRANLARATRGMKIKSAGALMEAAILIRSDMEKTPPLIPIDTGNLRASWFVSAFSTLKGPGLVMGFTTNYAIIVHEDMTKKIFQRPGSGPKFFESALVRNKRKILNIIAKNINLN